MVRLLVIEIAFLVLAVAVSSYPAFENGQYKHKIRDKGRSIRGFKNMDLSTARGFGKRAERRFDVNLLPSDLLADNRDDREFNQNVQPIDLDTVLKNKYLARSLLDKLINVNHDGFISVNELLQQNDGESL